MGRPFYERVGYKRVATVTRMTVGTQDVQFPSAVLYPNLHIQMDSVNSSSNLSNLDELLKLDFGATGLDRSKTLRALASYPYVSTVTVRDTINDGVVLAAMVTHHTGSPSIMVGPIVGTEKYVPTMFHAIRNHYQDGQVQEMACIVSNHQQLVDTLSTQLGFATAFELGAMTLHGKVLSCEDESLYLGIIHPTLG